jgi:hypothetical protein
MFDLVTDHQIKGTVQEYEDEMVYTHHLCRLVQRNAHVLSNGMPFAPVIQPPEVWCNKVQKRLNLLAVIDLLKLLLD